MTRADFTRQYYPVARSVAAGTGIFPEVMIAQAIIESQGKGTDGFYYPGLSQLSRNYNNYFGIKASAGWKGKTVNLQTGEVFNNTPVVITSAFRVYDSIQDSFKDYVKFLKENPRYEKAGVFTAATPEQQAERLQAAGYATNPQYANIIKAVMQGIRQFILTIPPAATSYAGLFIIAAVTLYAMSR